MAITKKLGTKKTIGKVKSPVKKSVTKKSYLKKIRPMRSFKISPADQPFLTISVTKQTIYWSILLGFIMAMQLWILKVQLEIVEITDSITALQ